MAWFSQAASWMSSQVSKLRAKQAAKQAAAKKKKEEAKAISRTKQSFYRRLDTAAGGYLPGGKSPSQVKAQKIQKKIHKKQAVKQKQSFIQKAKATTRRIIKKEHTRQKAIQATRVQAKAQKISIKKQQKQQFKKKPSVRKPLPKASLYKKLDKKVFRGALPGGAPRKKLEKRPLVTKTKEQKFVPKARKPKEALLRFGDRLKATLTGNKIALQNAKTEKFRKDNAGQIGYDPDKYKQLQRDREKLTFEVKKQYPSADTQSLITAPGALPSEAALSPDLIARELERKEKKEGWYKKLDRTVFRGALPGGAEDVGLVPVVGADDITAAQITANALDTRTTRDKADDFFKGWVPGGDSPYQYKQKQKTDEELVAEHGTLLTPYKKDILGEDVTERIQTYRENKAQKEYGNKSLEELKTIQKDKPYTFLGEEQYEE